MQLNRQLGAIFLVAGTCIGAGMLGLPVATANAGFVPSSLAFILVWFLMMLSALCVLEVSLWFKEDVNFPGMSKATIGNWGLALTWFSYLSLLYLLLVAYIAGGSEIIGGFLPNFIPGHAITIVISTVFAGFIYLGMRWVDGFNRFLVAGLVICYSLTIFLGLKLVKPANLEHAATLPLINAYPLIVTSFGFHILIPSLKKYLHYNVAQLRLAIIAGSMIALIVYLLWQLVILGSVPLVSHNSELSLTNLAQSSKPVVGLTNVLINTLEKPVIGILVKVFALCAILTSLTGVGLALFDFFADGLKIKKNLLGRGKLIILTFIPPLMIVLLPKYATSVFLKALNYGGIFASILHLVIPSLMVFYGRKKFVSMHYKLRIGKITLAAIFIAGLGVILVEILQEFNIFG